MRKNKATKELGTDMIVSLYLRAKDKDEEIEILKELTASDFETIIEILTDAGVYEQRGIKKCIVCGRLFRSSTDSCERCKYAAKMNRRRARRESSTTN